MALMTDPLAPGREVGKYEIVRRLASGGMAEIYLAKVRGIEGFRKHVVIKRMLPQFAAKPEFVRLFLNEARLAASLSHPNIATIFDIGEVDGIYFLAMEYLHGEDMSVIQWELQQEEARLPLEHALTVCVAVASGLHYAHEKRAPDGAFVGLVHRDISPSNIVVTYEGGVKLVDFGIAKMTALAEQTGTGTVKGKLAYMSPEQCNGLPIDRRSDIFSLGVVLYELTTQTRLFHAESDVEIVKAVMAGRIDPPSTRVPNYPPDLEAIVFKALQRRVEDRIATARDLQACLEGFARDHGIVLSTSALGEWMEHTLGGKEEPWAVETRNEHGKTLPPEGMAETRVMSEDAIAEAMTGEKKTTKSRDLSGAAHTVVVTREPSVEMPRKPWALWFVGAAALLAAAAAVAVAFLRPAVEAAPSPSPPVLVVADKGQVALESPQPTPPVSPPVPVAPAVVPPAPAAVPPPAPPRPRRVAAANPDRGPSEKDITLPFARREKELAACFTAAPEDAARAEQLAVRFQTAADGKVLSAEVLPAELTRTKLGACVAEIARSTTFGPQPGPVAFRIPVTIRRKLNASP